MNNRYNNSPFFYKRRETHEVKVGSIGIGGTNPIRIQSMTNENTKNVEATVAQIRALIEAGSEIVRLTVPTSQDVEALPLIRKRMKEENIIVPLVADIHFTPSIALKAVEYMEKIRINPGNFADRKKFAILEYTDKEYKLELERISETFIPLVLRAKELGVSIRIGTNHGSLSDRIMNRFGDTPEGMVESALEFIRIAESVQYKDIIVSMKASNTQVMIQAYRLLSARFLELGMTYPLHLGVTEAGDGKDGRIKSAIGIGSLLEDGLGDTIRVSLTENPVLEIPVAQELVSRYNSISHNVKNPKNEIESNLNEIESNKKLSFNEFRNPYQYSRFYSREIHLDNLKLGDKNPIRVELSFDSIPKNIEILVGKIFQDSIPKSTLPEIFHFPISSLKDLEILVEIKKKKIFPCPISFILLGEMAQQIHDILNELIHLDKWVTHYPHFTNEEEKEIFFGAVSSFQKDGHCIEWKLNQSDLNRLDDLLDGLKRFSIQNSLFSIEGENSIYAYRKLCKSLSHYDYPIVLNSIDSSNEKALYNSSIAMGSLLIDGIGDSIRIQFPGDPMEQLSLSYDILQGARLRLTKTEYISCPSCGRTQFDLEKTTAKIKLRTDHLKSVKIAVMGCIVNGPGEMADADFGYVGAAPHKVHLYKGKEIILKNVPEEIADEKLIDLIKENGMWVEKPSI